MKLAKYRMLTLQELEELEKEFVEFLVINGVTVDDWERLRASDDGNAIITAFSDVVFESIMRQTRFLEHWSPRAVKTFQCLSDKIILVGADVKEGSSINLVEANSEQMVQHFGELEFYRSEKPYDSTRESVIYEMISSGCTISDGQLFKKMLLAMVD
ncbi:MAG: DUF6495 family protein [Bacteroidota bacterium]